MDRAPLTLRAVSIVALALAAGSAASGCSFDLEDVEPAPTGSGSGGAGGAGVSSATTSSTGSVSTSTGSSTSTGAGGNSGAGGAGGSGPPSVPGCADGTREAYLDAMVAPDIAACAGGFDVPGVTTQASLSTQCNREAGDDGLRPSGTGCSVEDLCEQGWHVCRDSVDVAAHAPGAACPTPASPKEFWLTRQVMNPSSSPDIACVHPTGNNDNNLVGCGQGLGQTPDGGDNCGPLTVFMKQPDCQANSPWMCNDGDHEADIVTKPGAALGGVLCCKGP